MEIQNEEPSFPDATAPPSAIAPDPVPAPSAASAVDVPEAPEAVPTDSDPAFTG
jgi:hypothetical protein